MIIVISVLIIIESLLFTKQNHKQNEYAESPRVGEHGVDEIRQGWDENESGPGDRVDQMVWVTFHAGLFNARQRVKTARTMIHIDYFILNINIF